MRFRGFDIWDGGDHPLPQGEEIVDAVDARKTYSEKDVIVERFKDD